MRRPFRNSLNAKREWRHASIRRRKNNNAGSRRGFFPHHSLFRLYGVLRNRSPCRAYCFNVRSKKTRAEPMGEPPLHSIIHYLSNAFKLSLLSPCNDHSIAGEIIVYPFQCHSQGCTHHVDGCHVQHFLFLLSSSINVIPAGVAVTAGRGGQSFP